MYTCNLLFLWGICNAFTHALTLPLVDNGVIIKQDGWPAETLLPTELIKRASPPPAAKPKPATPKPAPEAKPPAAKPPPIAKPPVNAPPKVTPAPTSKPVAWPYVKVPYVTVAFDTCGVFVDCDESIIEKESEDVVARGITPTRVTEKAAARAPALAPIRRDVRTYKVKHAGISIKNLDYPGASDLFSPPKGANVRINVFDFNSDKVADYKVKNLKSKPASYDGYVTEHIVELQTVMMFLNSLSIKDAKRKPFFVTWWNKELDAATVAKRPNKPAIPMGDQTTINNMVFESLGSNNNREDFVLCEDEINGYKARIWNKGNPMAVTRYKRAVNEAVAGAIDSNVYLTALRNTLAVFEYLNNPEVKLRLQASIKNVGIELKNVEHLTKEKWDLTNEWELFMKSHLANVETKAKEWIKDRIVKETEGQITNMITKLQRMETELKVKETGKDKAAQEKKAKAASDKLDAEIKTAKAAVEAQEKVLKTRDAELKVKRDAFNKKNSELRKKTYEFAAVVKQISKEKDAKKKADLTKTKDTLEKDMVTLESEKDQAQAEKEKSYSARDKAKEDKMNKSKVVGLKQREKWSLRSLELKDVIDNLEADKKIVAAFKAAGANIKMPAMV